MYAFEKWDRHEETQHALLEVCYRLRKENRISNVANRAKSLFESDFNFFREPEPVVRDLLEYCRQCVFEAANHANKGRWEAGQRIGIDMHEAWCHITAAGGYHDVHTHPNSAWSGIYYIRAGESDLESKNGINRFYAPWAPPAYSDIGTQWSSQTSSIDLAAEDGVLICFPSWLLHSAMTYVGNIERVVVAFNCKFIDGSNNVTLNI